MTAPSTTPTAGVRQAGQPGRRSGGNRRLVMALADLALAGLICALGFRYGADFLRASEARWVAGVLEAVGVDRVSGALPRHIMIFPDDGQVILAEVTESCSSILAVLGLTALAVAVLRGRRQHAVAGLVVAVAALLLLNHLRLVASVVAGLVWGAPALVLFHDWVGTVWNLAATLGGFLLMVSITLPAAERAEQSVDGKHTARRPDSWARPGLGYRMDGDEERASSPRFNLTGLMYRYVLPARVARRLAARREAARIDYRIGHLPAAERAARVRVLAENGLGAHAATLLAVATYDDDPAVLDVLAEQIAARQWEPVTGPRVSALRLWARGWLLQQVGRRDTPVPQPGDPRTPPLPPLPAAVPVPIPDPRPHPHPHPHPHPRSFARPPVPPGRPRPVSHLEELR